MGFLIREGKKSKLVDVFMLEDVAKVHNIGLKGV